jgi:hypothetical protein
MVYHGAHFPELARAQNISRIRESYFNADRASLNVEVTIFGVELSCAADAVPRIGSIAMF